MALARKQQGVISGSLIWDNKEYITIFDKNFKYLYGEVDDLFIAYGAWVEYDVIEAPQSHPKNCFKKAINVNMEVKISRAPTTDEFSRNLMNVRVFNKVDYFQYDGQGDGNLTHKSTIRRDFSDNRFYNEYYGEVIVPKDSKHQLLFYNINVVDVMMNFIPSSRYCGTGPHWEVTHFVNEGTPYGINGFLSIRGLIVRGPGGVVRSRRDVIIPPDSLRPVNNANELRRARQHAANEMWDTPTQLTRPPERMDPREASIPRESVQKVAQKVAENWDQPVRSAPPAKPQNAPREASRQAADPWDQPLRPAPSRSQAPSNADPWDQPERHSAPDADPWDQPHRTVSSRPKGPPKHDPWDEPATARPNAPRITPAPEMWDESIIAPRFAREKPQNSVPKNLENGFRSRDKSREMISRNREKSREHSHFEPKNPNYIPMKPREKSPIPTAKSNGLTPAPVNLSTPTKPLVLSGFGAREYQRSLEKLAAKAEKSEPEPPKPRGLGAYGMKTFAAAARGSGIAFSKLPSRGSNRFGSGGGGAQNGFSMAIFDTLKPGEVLAPREFEEYGDIKVDDDWSAPPPQSFAPKPRRRGGLPPQVKTGLGKYTLNEFRV